MTQHSQYILPLMPTLSDTKVVFLDRDGVINRDSAAYVKSWAEFEFLPGSLAALRRMTAGGLGLIVISNQSAVNRGLVSLDTLLDMHRRLQAEVAAAGGCITDIFFCPHRPQDGCTCRKPLPGLVRQACRKHGIDPRQAIMVGDSLRDIECARNAGCKAAVLVKTGNGVSTAATLARRGIPIAHVAEDLGLAADWVLAQISASDFTVNAS
ncbi:MAG: D-glycero-beta-D-manno-heptose 1,7-bisphosphate 7-phosphatase [Desulfobacterales bacterium]